MAKTMADRAKASRARLEKVNGQEYVEQQSKNNSRKKSSPHNHSKPNNNQTSGNRGRTNKCPTKPASAAYNFVRLPEHVIPAEFYNGHFEGVTKDVLKAYCDHVQQADTHTGYIDLTITTETPLFIGGLSKQNEETPLEFYGGQDNPIIPGTSLKGMVKQIFKIVTASSFRPYQRGTGLGDFEDRYLYFRDIASTIRPLKDYYEARMVGKELNSRGEEKSATKATPGFIIQTLNNDYFVIPSTSKKRSYSGDYEMQQKKNRASIDWTDQYVNIHTGRMDSKMSYMRITRPGNFEDKRIPILQECIDSYKDDKNRGTLNLLDKKVGKSGDAAKNYTRCNDVKFVVPCFFTEKDGVVVHFGHGRFYRIAYDLKISDHLPSTLEQYNNGVDLCDSVFGHGDNWAGRLCFTDGHVVGPVRMCQSEYPHPLMGPNPTSFQLYLEQQDVDDYDRYNHWGHEGASLRGYKMYWHQPLAKAKAWTRTTEEKAIKGTRKIRPVDIGVTFTSRIHFNCLSDVELGALLMTLNLDQYSGGNRRTYYKLGMGKSIGFGSIKLESKVTLFDGQERYTNLFAGDTWNTGSITPTNDEFIQSFTQYRDDMLGSRLSSYKDMLNDLYMMMDWNIANGPSPAKKWNEATKMMLMTDKRLRYRTKLDMPKSFIEKWSK
jgi:CRISPR-associated protein